jgi:hypothetical protein
VLRQGLLAVVQYVISVTLWLCQPPHTWSWSSSSMSVSSGTDDMTEGRTRRDNVTEYAASANAPHCGKLRRIRVRHTVALCINTFISPISCLISFPSHNMVQHGIWHSGLWVDQGNIVNGTTACQEGFTYNEERRGDIVFADVNVQTNDVRPSVHHTARH